MPSPLLDATMSNAPDVSIVIVNWNSQAFLRKCLSSIYAGTKGLDFEIVVVDNASFDGCNEMISEEFPQVRFIQSQENRGFARANNLGFEHSTGRNILFLNPDTEVVGSALERMVACLESAPDGGVVGPKLLNSDLSVQTSCIQRFPSIWSQLFDFNYLRQLFPKSRFWGMKALFEEYRGPVEVDAISGACLMIRRITFQKIGFFSAEYFMYAEDMDLCYKVRQAGSKIYHIGDAGVVHHGGRSAKSKPESNFQAVMMRESILKFIRATRGRFYAAIYQSTTALAAAFRLGVLGLIILLTLGMFRRNSLLPAFTKWVRLLRWAFGREGWVKQETE